MKYRSTEEETFRQIIINIITVNANIDIKRSDIDDTDAKIGVKRVDHTKCNRIKGDADAKTDARMGGW